ncbi:hypothetical protein [Streptomyces sp. NBC_00878]|uniref:hypothetical protein n=1 Tax=Streptomyces sp. NBC_00878 TaxID=2975854 RepID=UPI002256C95E|nr:hypothetical protein [Streptomyces sp. NBC_00878]MCX4911809.1 hypothetical protein [Streptomyces sp. NBC_00878]
MAAQLAATVYVTDPETRQSVTLHPGTCPEPRLAALVTSRAAWVDGKLPRPPKTAGTGDGPDGASGDASETSGDANPQAAPAAKKTAARKTAATKPARGRDAAGEGDSGD